MFGRVITRVFRFVVAFLLVPLTMSFVHQTWNLLQNNSKALLLDGILIGLLSYLLMYLVFLRNKIQFIETFEHELCHIVVGKLMLRNIHSFEIGTGGWGRVMFFSIPDGQGEILAYEPDPLQEPRSDGIAIALAPYCLPLTTIPLVVIYVLAPVDVQPIFGVIIGISLAFHYVGLIREFSPRQKDIKDTGLFFSIILVILSNAILLAIIVLILLGNGSDIKDYFQNALADAQLLYIKLVQASA